MDARTALRGQDGAGQHPGASVGFSFDWCALIVTMICPVECSRWRGTVRTGNVTQFMGRHCWEWRDELMDRFGRVAIIRGLFNVRKLYRRADTPT